MAKRMLVEQGLTVDQIKMIPRSEVRYALFNASRGASTSNKNQQIIDFFAARIKEIGFEFHEFADPKGWDISKEDCSAIVSGHIVRQYHNELNASLFDTEGNLK